MKPRTVSSIQAELQALAEGLPFSVVATGNFRQPGFEPRRVRQERTYSRDMIRLHAIGRYLHERGIVPVLSREDSDALFEEMHWCGWSILTLAGAVYRDEKSARAALTEARRLVSRIEEAEEELFIANRRMVVNCVKPYFWVGQVWITDFLQEGSKALSNAIRKFEYVRGTPFYSYAQTAVQNRLRNYFRDHIRSGAISIRPSTEMETLQALERGWRETHYGTAPDDTQLSDITGISEHRVHQLRNLIRQWERSPDAPLSLDASLNEEGGNLYELLEAEVADIPEAAMQNEVWDAVRQLPERTRIIIQRRYMEGRTLEEIGAEVGLTRARIKQIQDEAVRKLRDLLRERTRPD